MNHAQRGKQPGQFSITVETGSGQRVPGKTGPIEFTLQTQTDIFQLLLQRLAQCRVAVQLSTEGQAEQYRKRCLQGVPQIAQCIA